MKRGNQSARKGIRVKIQDSDIIIKHERGEDRIVQQQGDEKRPVTHLFIQS